MVIAAKTAPKGRGESNLVIRIAERDDIENISKKMREFSIKYDVASFSRDADNILLAPFMLLLGGRIKPLELKKCGMCGFENCTEKNNYPNVPCVFNTGDLGIAIGSAVSVAMNMRVDNRIMYTVGQAVIEMNLLGDEVKVVYAIPLSVTSKNPFFDRK